MTITEAKTYLDLLPEEADVNVTISNRTETYVTSGQVEKLGVSRQLLNYYVKTGQIRTTPHGKQKRYLLTDILNVR